MTEIQHDTQHQRFFIDHEKGSCHLDYQLDSEQTSVDFTHTFVPFSLRGQGLAEKLVHHGLAWAKEQNLNIKASCWYVDKFLRT